MYLSPDGIDYDKVGIPPDIVPKTELLPLAEREEGVDSWLELALQTTKGDTPTSTPTSNAALVSHWTVLWVASLLLAISNAI